MNIVDKVQQLQNDVVATDENYEKLKDALDEYHRLIQEGKLIPRKNNVQDIYTVYSFKSNIWNTQA